MAEPKVNLYHCSACGKTLKRESTRQWIKSWCCCTERVVRLSRVEVSPSTKKVIAKVVKRYAKCLKELADK